MGPDNTVYHGPSESPFLVTMVRNRARLTVFLNRNGGPETRWAGTWNLMATYKPRTKKQYMVMSNIWELLEGRRLSAVLSTLATTCPLPRGRLSGRCRPDPTNPSS